MVKTLAIAAAMATAIPTVPSGDPWAQRGFTKVETTTIRPTTNLPAATARLRLGFLILRGSAWESSMIQPHLDTIAREWGECGIGVESATVYPVSAPGGRTVFSKFEQEGKDSLEAFAATLPLSARPLFLLFSGYTDQDDDRAFSSAPFIYGPVRPGLFDMAFLPAGVLSEEYRRDRVGSPYDIAHHELSHILTREGQHVLVPERNIMNIWRKRGDKVLPVHCEKALNYPGLY